MGVVPITLINDSYSFAVDSNGNVFIADRDNHRVMKWEPGSNEGEPVAGGNGVGSELRQLNDPISIVIDSNDNLYVADRGNHRIVKVKLKEQFLYKI